VNHPEPGHSAGTPTTRARIRSGVPSGPEPQQGQVLPRLLDLTAAAQYLGGISLWTVRDLVNGGVLKRVRIPGAGGGELRRVLLDRHELDRLVEAWKDRDGR
jgi:hypothetical protein